MWKTIKNWLLGTEPEFKYNALDRDKDGVVQEGTQYERTITVVKDTTKKPVKKKAAKKPIKKAPAKKPAAKKKAVKKANGKTSR